MTDPDLTRASGNPENESSPAPQFGMQDQEAYKRYHNRTNKVLWGLFVLLLALAGGVFFVLPAFVSPPDNAGRVVVVESGRSAEGPAAISPFEEAQRLREREAAQNALAALLELQETLEQKQVERWAGEAFNAGIEFARQGDEAYREQEFVTARELYQQGVDTLQGIVDREEELYAGFVVTGQEALLAGDAQAAGEAFSLALLVNETGTEAVDGLDRAEVLDEVLTLLEEGRTLHENGELEAARDKYEEAGSLDPEHREVNGALEQVSADIEQRDFSSAMSRGYAALQNNDPEAAEEAFRQAEAIRPQSPEVASALQQAADQKTNTQLNRHMTAARRHEADENWQAALREWEAALAVDPNLVVADQGVRRARQRRDLDVFFTTVMREPLRLVDATIYQQTQQLLRDLDQISDQGPRLREQISAVSALLEQARVPVSVLLKSDGMTSVDLLREELQGRFNSRSVELIPGHYVAIGTREGYRDVRVEFTVNIGGEPPVVTVVCTETI